MLIQCGDAERLRDEGTLLAHKASLADVQVEHEIYEDCKRCFITKLSVQLIFRTGVHVFQASG